MGFGDLCNSASSSSRPHIVLGVSLQAKAHERATSSTSHSSHLIILVELRAAESQPASAAEVTAGAEAEAEGRETVPPLSLTGLEANM